VSSQDQKSSESDEEEGENDNSTSDSEMYLVILMVATTVTIGAVVGNKTLNILMEMNLGMTELIALLVANVLVGGLALYLIFVRKIFQK
jgi:hypothetical protein